MLYSFLLNLLLAGLYLALTDEVTFFNLLIGFAIGFVIMMVASRARGGTGYGRRMWGLVRFVGYFLFILTKANLQVTWEIITPGFRMHPRIIRYPVSGLTPTQVTMLASAITLTPGTLTADIDEAGDTLYIHCMYARDRDSAVRDLDELRDRLMREVFGK